MWWHIHSISNIGKSWAQRRTLNAGSSKAAGSSWRSIKQQVVVAVESRLVNWANVQVRVGRATTTHTDRDMDPYRHIPVVVIPTDSAIRWHDFVVTRQQPLNNTYICMYLFIHTSLFTNQLSSIIIISAGLTNLWHGDNLTNWLSELNKFCFQCEILCDSSITRMFQIFDSQSAVISWGLTSLWCGDYLSSWLQLFDSWSAVAYSMHLNKCHFVKSTEIRTHYIP